MRKITIIITSFLVVLSTSLMSQIPNSGFEDWAGNEPTNWDNLNSLTILPAYSTCIKGTPGNPGSSYIKLISKTVLSLGTFPGIAVCGKIDKVKLQPKSGFAYNQRPTALTGNWQYKAYGNDQGVIGIFFTKWNTITNIRDTISSTFYWLPDSVMNWESFNIPITFTDSSNPDTCLIVLSASGLTPVKDSYLYVDNLNFAGVNSVSENNEFMSTVDVYPNPVTEQLQVKLPDDINPTSINYKIVNNLGQIIQTSDNFRHNSIEVSNLPKGFYQLLIESKEKQYIAKFIKQ